MTTITVDFTVATTDTARAAAVVDDVLSGVNDRLEAHAEANAESDDPDPDIEWQVGEPVDVAALRKRLGMISHVIDRRALLAAMRVAMPDVADNDLTFAALSEQTVIDLVARFDVPGVYVNRTEATTYRAERAEVGVIMPSGDYCTISCEGHDPSRWTRTPEVNWPACGATSVADTLAFAAAVSFAAGVASSLSGPIAEVGA